MTLFDFFYDLMAGAKKTTAKLKKLPRKKATVGPSQKKRKKRVSKVSNGNRGIGAALVVIVGVLALGAIFFAPKSPFFLQGYVGSLSNIDWNFDARADGQAVGCQGGWRCGETVCVCENRKPVIKNSTYDASVSASMPAASNILELRDDGCVGNSPYSAPTILSPSAALFIPSESPASVLVTGTGSRQGASINLFAGREIVGSAVVSAFESSGGISYRWRINVHDLPQGVNVLTATEKNWGSESPPSDPRVVVVGNPENWGK